MLPQKRFGLHTNNFAPFYAQVYIRYLKIKAFILECIRIPEKKDFKGVIHDYSQSKAFCQSKMNELNVVNEFTTFPAVHFLLIYPALPLPLDWQMLPQVITSALMTLSRAFPKLYSALLIDFCYTGLFNTSLFQIFLKASAFCSQCCLMLSLSLPSPTSCFMNFCCPRLEETERMVETVTSVSLLAAHLNTSTLLEF